MDMTQGNTVEMKLEKSFKPLDVLALGFGSMIGWGWIMLSGKWAVQGGMLGAILSFIVGAVLCIFVGLTYAELTPAIPSTGGSVAFSIQAMGKLAALIAGLGTTLAYLGVASWEGPALVSSISYLVPIPQVGYLWTIQGVDVYALSTLIAVAGAAILMIINIRGAKQTAVFQTVATIGIIVVGVLFLFGSVAFGDVENVCPLVTSSSGLMAVMLVVPAMFSGFDVIPQAAGEMDVPLKKIPKLLILSILSAGIWYILMIIATCLSAPLSVRVDGVIPVADSMAYAYGNPFWGKVCIVGALCGIITSWNGFLFGAARCIYYMATMGMLPPFLAKTHPQYHTPYNAVIFCGAVCIVASLFGNGALGWFVNASAFGTVIMYAMVVLSFIMLRKRQPNLPRPFKIEKYRLVAVCSVAVVLFFVYLYMPFGPSSLSTVEWGLVLGWFVLGTAAFLLNKHKTPLAEK